MSHWTFRSHCLPKLSNFLCLRVTIRGFVVLLVFRLAIGSCVFDTLLTNYSICQKYSSSFFHFKFAINAFNIYFVVHIRGKCTNVDPSE